MGITGLGLLFLTAFFGVEQYGARLWLKCRFPAREVVRWDIVFIAGILSENSSFASYCQAGSFSIPEPGALMPLLSIWVLFLFVLVVQRDLGSAILYYALFALLSYAATGQIF